MIDITKLLAYSLGTVSAISAFAHDAWVEPGNGAYSVRYGHGDKVESYVPEKVKALSAVSAEGATLPVTIEKTGDSVRATVKGQAAIVMLHFDNGVWTKTADGSKNLPKNEVAGALSATHSVKFGKTIVAWGPQAGKAWGQRLEIVPAAPDAPAAGAVLPVTILWEGKPLAGAKVARADYGKEKPIETDADGKVGVPVIAGRQTVTVSHTLPLGNDPRADNDSVSANLVFEAR